MKRKFHQIFFTLTIILAVTQTAKTQTLADTLEYSFHKQFAPVFKEKKVKRIYYSLELPFLISYSYELKTKKGESKWGEDTILVSNNYDTNGFYRSRVETRPDGSLNKKIEYFFSDSGVLTRITTTDSSRLRDFQFQTQDLIYNNNKLTAIKKIAIRSGDTVTSVLTFHYAWNKMIQAIELTSNNQLVLSSLFSYDEKKNYIKEENLEILSSGTETRTTYYYTFDDNNRIDKVYGDYKNFKRKRKPVKEFTYDFVKEAYIFETFMQKIEWYE
jgi:hypothetical protein